MHIWIFQTGEPLHCDTEKYRPMRAVNLSNMLIERGHNVEIISSDFYHQLKLHRTGKFSKLIINKLLNINLIPSTGYTKHVGIARLFDHLILSLNLIIFLYFKKPRTPDFVFIGYPPIECAFVLQIWLHARNINFLLDIKDNWPVTFLQPFPKIIHPILKILFFPYYVISKYTIKNASIISSITPNFLKWSQQFSKRKLNSATTYNSDFVLPLVRRPIDIKPDDLSQSFIYWKDYNLDISLRKHFTFVGSLTNSFDFDILYHVSKYMYIYDPSISFVICGSGDQFQRLKKLFSDSLNVLLVGKVNEIDAYTIINSSIATLSPYNNFNHFNMSIPNKVIESLEYSTPFITTLSGDVAFLARDYNVGIASCTTPDLFKDACLKLYKNPKLRSIMSDNAINLYNSNFNYYKIYADLVDRIEKLTNY
ncbi:glycosyltransferase [Prochlorococcus marinus]|uniref:Glycosyl transferase family 1 domain-containing protein n=1 Tax=Prochlorococcus marinus XMU1408 TaxID=2213228 RepID=A0A318R465_PROMR|nr:glycosyltransferase [Prochlorococcus marinus]MBW3041836.1 hypothetical protein [Prochlorococcus marinus str. XMU1408]PYE02974.1 hypothetical protein DNJ73_04295 [Prochlorococcus marinus XMU1408]